MINSYEKLISNKSSSLKIAFLGDSITSAEWVHPNWREIIEYVLKEDAAAKMSDWKDASWGIRTFNCGFDGATSKELLEMLPEKVLALNLDLLIYVASSNDHHFDINPQQSTEYNRQILQKIIDSGTETAFASSIKTIDNNYNQILAPYSQMQQQLAQELKLPYSDLFNEFGESDPAEFFTLKSAGNDTAGIKPGDIDFLHPNVPGNCIIAEVLLKDFFGISFNSSIYLNNLDSGEMIPGFQ